MTVAVVNLYHVYNFEGVNMQDGDQAYFVLADKEGTADCRTAMPRTPTRVVRNYTVTLTIAHPGLHVLCYLWSSQGVTLVQPHIRVAAIWVHTIWPLGTGLGCATNLTLEGGGFPSLFGLDDTPEANCHFRYSEDDILIDATLAELEYIRAAFMPPSGTELICPTPQLQRTASLKFTIEFYLGKSSTLQGGDDVSDATLVLDQGPFNMPDVRVFDPGAITITEWSPGGSRYNMPTNVTVKGSNFVVWPGRAPSSTPSGYGGNATCSFGPSLFPPYRTYQGEWAEVLRTDQLVCDFPSIPDEERDQLGELNLRYMPNGQCPSITPNASYWTWNALLNSVTPIAAPFTTAVSLNIFGEGFPVGFHPEFSKAACRFSATDGGGTVSGTPLATLSNSRLACPTPSTSSTSITYGSEGRPSESWRLDVLLNGQQEEPQHGQSARLGSAQARPLCLLSARLAALGSSVLPE